MLGGYINVREWRIWTRGGARWEKPCRFGGGVLRLWNVGFGMGHAARECSPTDRSSTQKPCGLLYQKTPISPMRTDGSFHGSFTLAPLPTAWFLMRRRRGRSTRIFSHAESCVGECHTMGLLGMRKICGNPRDLWATTKRTMR